MRVSTGRFAPSTTGPLHLGSLVAALGSWLFARAKGGRWLVRMEDLDAPRVVPGAADEILRTLERYGLTWDEEVAFQSRRLAHYDAALEILRERGMVYACSCSRADLARAASAPDRGDPPPAGVYPGTCRGGLPSGKETRAVRFPVRFRAPPRRRNHPPIGAPRPAPRGHRSAARTAESRVSRREASPPKRRLRRAST